MIEEIIVANDDRSDYSYQWWQRVTVTDEDYRADILDEVAEITIADRE